MTKSALSLVTFTCGHSVPQGRGGVESFRSYPCQDCQDKAIRDLRFSKRYALGLPDALAELDALYAQREALR